MRDYIRFVMRSREGLYAYLKFMLKVFGALFVVHMIVLAVLVAAGYAGGYNDNFGTMLYETVGIAAGGIASAVMTERLLRVCVSSGISRKSFLRGQLQIMPLFALATSAAVMLIFMITDGIYHLFGLQFNSFAAELEYVSNQYQPRALAFNLITVFCLELFFYSFLLLIVGFRKRFKLRIGMIAAILIVCLGLMFMCRGILFYPVNMLLYPVRLVLALIKYSAVWVDIERIAVEGVPNDVCMPPDQFWSNLLMLIAVVVIWFLLCSGMFRLLTARASVRGTEREG